MSVKGTFSHKKKCNYFSNKNPSNLYTRNYKIHQTSLKAIYFCTLKKTLENAVIKIVDIRNENYNENMKKCIREIKCIDKLNHDNVIKHHFASMDVDKIWIVMEPCIGSIQDLMKVHKVYFNEKEIIAIVKQTLSGLIYIHNKNRIHRDIKSSHLLITYNGIVKISNFESSSNQRQSNKFEGSFHWMAPEIIMAYENGDYNQKCDIWSLGICLIELAEKFPPNYNMTGITALHQILYNELPKFKNPAKWSENLLNFLSTCLTFNHKDRPKSEDLYKKSIHMNKIKKLKKKLIEDNIIEFEIKWKNMYEKDKQNFNNEIKEMSYLKQRSRLKSFKLKFNKDKILSKDTFLISAEQKNLIKLAELEKNCIKDYYSSEIEFMNELYSLKKKFFKGFADYRLQYDSFLKNQLVNNIRYVNQAKIILLNNLHEIEFNNQLQHNTNTLSQFHQNHLNFIKDTRKNNKKIKREFVRNEREYKTSLSKLKGDNAAPFKIKELRKNFEKTVELFKNEYNFVVGGPSNQQTALYETSFLSCIIKLQKEMEVFLRYQKLHKRRIATANINDYEQVVHASNIRRFSLEKELALEEQDIESRHKQDVEKFNQCCKDTLADYDVTLNIKLEMFRNENNV